MRALFRFLSRGPGGAVESRDREFEGEAITLGRATDQVLNFKDRRVDLEHARIVLAGGRVLVTSRALTGVMINGTVRRDGALAPGDVLQIGANLLKFFPPPLGYDLAFTFELDPNADTRAAERVPLKLSLAEVGAGKRRWAWTAFVVLLLAGLVLPWLSAPASHMLPALRQAPLPSDHAWSSGPLHSAHSTIAAQCERCHSKPFQRVTDQSCLSCHAASLHRHVAVAQNVELPQLAATRCASCHAEHNEPQQLVRADEHLCVSCHRNLQNVATRDTGLGRVSDFLTDHPEFRVSLRSAAAQGGDVQRLRLDDAALTEQSGLKFPHRKHLNAAGIKSTEGNRVLSCADCHQPEAGGARMRPVRMEEHCAGCHVLSFDPREPARSVPHGSPERVLQSLTEYYSAAYLAGYPDRLGTAQPSRPAALPGRDLSATERARLLVSARDKARVVARDMFERRSCQTCHTVTKSADGNSWTVKAVQLTQQWMPKANFSHAAHATSLTPCKSCHAAETSERATQVLMPRIAECRSCHGGARSAGAERVSSSCTLCHGFHIPANPLWATAAESRAAIGAGVGRP